VTRYPANAARHGVPVQAGIRQLMAASL
jgi:hypothetical protein